MRLDQVHLTTQAKGRVERSFGTDQDRLVKLLRLAKIKDAASANAFLEKEYWPEWNERFAAPPSSVTDLHRPLSGQVALVLAGIIFNLQREEVCSC